MYCQVIEYSDVRQAAREILCSIRPIAKKSVGLQRAGCGITDKLNLFYAFVFCRDRLIDGEGFYLRCRASGSKCVIAGAEIMVPIKDFIYMMLL